MADETVESLRAKLKESEMNNEMADGCLDMIRETLEVTCGTKMDATPPMFYNDAIRATVARHRREAVEELAKACVDIEKHYAEMMRELKIGESTGGTIEMAYTRFVVALANAKGTG